jgi:hypothetical protein
MTVCLFKLKIFKNCNYSFSKSGVVIAHVGECVVVEETTTVQPEEEELAEEDKYPCPK